MHQSFYRCVIIVLGHLIVKPDAFLSCIHAHIDLLTHIFLLFIRSPSYGGPMYNSSYPHPFSSAPYPLSMSIILFRSSNFSLKDVLILIVLLVLISICYTLCLSFAHFNFLIFAV